MTKDFVNKKRHTKITKINYSLLLLSVLVLFFCGITFIIYKYGNSYQPHPSLYVAKLSAWIDSQKHHINKTNEHLNSLKTVKMKSNTNASPIHFEFYSILPDMEVGLADAKPVSDHKLVSARQSSIVNVEDLERELSSTIKDTSQSNHMIKQKRGLK